MKTIQPRVRIQPPRSKPPTDSREPTVSSILFVAVFRSRKLQQDRRLQPMMTRNRVVRRAEQDLCLPSNLQHIQNKQNQGTDFLPVHILNHQNLVLELKVRLHTRRRLQPCIERGRSVPGTKDQTTVQNRVSIQNFVALRSRRFESHGLKMSCKMVVALEHLVVLSMLAYQTRSPGSCCYLAVVFELFPKQAAFRHSKVFFLTE